MSEGDCSLERETVLLVVTSCLLDWEYGLCPYLAAGGAHLLLRDAMKGQSVGKFLLGLCDRLETGSASSLAGSGQWRNLLLLLPGANVVAIFLEAATLVRDPQGQRLGDRLAQTQVVEGLGAKDPVKAFQDWLMGLGDLSSTPPSESEAVLRCELRTPSVGLRLDHWSRSEQRRIRPWSG